MPFSAAFSHSTICSSPPPPNTRCSMDDLNNVGILYDACEKNTDYFTFLHLFFNINTQKVKNIPLY